MIGALAGDAWSEGFFGGLLEYTPQPGEIKITKRHTPHIKTAEANLRDRLLDYGEELLLEFWPQVRGKAIDDSQLVAMGLSPERPDPADYI
jgi:hypothetical protein